MSEPEVADSGEIRLVAISDGQVSTYGYHLRMGDGGGFDEQLEAAWDAGITEGEAFDGTNPGLMAERAGSFDRAAEKIRAPFKEPTRG